MDMWLAPAYGMKLAGLLEGLLKLGGHLQIPPKTIPELVEAASAVIASTAKLKTDVANYPSVAPENGHAQFVWLVKDGADKHVMMCPSEPDDIALASIAAQIGQMVSVEQFLLAPTSLAGLVDGSLLPPLPKGHGVFSTERLNDTLTVGYSASQVIEAQKLAVALDRHANPRISHAPTPTFVVEMDNGTVLKTSGSHPGHIIFLDIDTEGVDQENILRIGTQDYYAIHHEYQVVRGMSDGGSAFVEMVVERLTEVDEAADEEALQARYLTGHWSHIFRDSKQQSTVRLVFDTTIRQIIAMDCRYGHGYVPASFDDVEDVLDSLLTANSDALENPAEFGLERVHEMPAWAQGATLEVQDEEIEAPRS